MSSTDDPELAERIRRFFDDELLPAAAALRRRKGELFPLRPEAGRESYYVERPRRTMRAADFELGGLESPELLGSALEELWNARDLGELAALAPGLSRLAGELREVEEESEEVSPFIYVMF